MLSKKANYTIHTFIHTHAYDIKFKDMQNNSIYCLKIYAYVIKVLKCTDMLSSGQRLPVVGKEKN